ncbi:MAG: pentapeptide repeat-containing protein [Thermodesulfobacteriota bacterium]
MHPSVSRPLVFLCLFLFSACGAATINQAVDSGANPLDNEDIYSLVNDNTLRLVSADFDSYLFFGPNGSLSASSIFSHSLDYGRWDITSDSRLCIRYSVWYYGDLNCYSVYHDEKKSDNYLLFHENGSLAFTGTVSPGNAKHLKVKSRNGDKPVYVRSSIEQGQSTSYSSPSPSPPSSPSPPAVAAPGPGASREEINHTVKTLAKDCPGCNLAEADLRQAELIGANLKGANLKGADLSRANLRRANLEGADLRGATLLSTNLPGANLKGADLTGSDLSGSNLIKADLTGATLKNAILDNTLREGSKGIK